MRNILFIAKFNKFGQENSPNRFHFLNFLTTKNNIQILNDDTNISLVNWIDKSTWKPDIIIYYFLSSCKKKWLSIDISDFDNSKLTAKKMFIFEDSHYIKELLYLYKKYKFDKFVQLGYNIQVTSKLKEYRIPYVLWNHYIDLSKFKIYNVKKEYDFLFYGFTDPKIYPLRYKIYQALKILQQNTHMRIKFIEHPGYIEKNHTLPINEKLSIEINKSRFCFATSSIYNIFTKKYIEIALSGTTIIGNIPSGYGMLLHGNIIEIKNSNNHKNMMFFNKEQTVNDIKNILKDAYYNNYINIENKRLQLTIKMREMYGYEKGYEDLNLLLI